MTRDISKDLVRFGGDKQVGFLQAFESISIHFRYHIHIVQLARTACIKVYVALLASILPAGCRRGCLYCPTYYLVVHVRRTLSAFFVGTGLYIPTGHERQQETDSRNIELVLCHLITEAADPFQITLTV